MKEFFKREMICKCHIYSRFMITIKYSSTIHFLKLEKTIKYFFLPRFVNYRNIKFMTLLKKCVGKFHHLQKVGIPKCHGISWHWLALGQHVILGFLLLVNDGIFQHISSIMS